MPEYPERVTARNIHRKSSEEIATFGQTIIEAALTAERAIDTMSKLMPEGRVMMPDGYKIKVTPSDRSWPRTIEVFHPYVLPSSTEPWNKKLEWRKSEEKLNTDNPFLADSLTFDTRPYGYGVILVLRAATEDGGYKELKIEPNTTIDLFSFEFVEAPVQAAQEVS